MAPPPLLNESSHFPGFSLAIEFYDHLGMSSGRFFGQKNHVAVVLERGSLVEADRAIGRAYYRLADE
ncbi:hypothetical protein [Nitrospira sp. M1]